MPKKDKGFDALLEVLKANPEAIREIAFHPEKIPKLLKSKAARRLARDNRTTQFLAYMAAPADGYPIAFCYGGTQSLCGKGTLACVGNTRPNPTCPGNTRPAPPTPTCPGNTRALVNCSGNTAVILNCVGSTGAEYIVSPACLRSTTAT
jgi:hypothetical protein